MQRVPTNPKLEGLCPFDLYVSHGILSYWKLGLFCDPSIALVIIDNDTEDQNVNLVGCNR